MSTPTLTYDGTYSCAACGPDQQGPICEHWQTFLKMVCEAKELALAATPQTGKGPDVEDPKTWEGLCDEVPQSGGSWIEHALAALRQAGGGE